MSFVTDFVNWLTGAQPPAKVETFGRRPYVKREFMTGPEQQPARGWETQWELPAVNQVLEIATHGMEAGAATNMVRHTAASLDPRGEPDAIKGLQEVTVPDWLMNDRIYSAAVERSELRPLTTETLKYGL